MYTHSMALILFVCLCVSRQEYTNFCMDAEITTVYTIDSERPHYVFREIEQLFRRNFIY